MLKTMLYPNFSFRCNPSLWLVGILWAIAGCSDTAATGSATDMGASAAVESVADAYASGALPAPANPETRDWPKLLVLGDSISAAYGIQREQGWVELLQQHVQTEELPLLIVNASISGETTGGGLARLPQALSDHEPTVVVIELGGNDGLRGYPIEKIRSNLSEMVRLSKSSGARVLLVGMQIPPNYGARYSNAFSQLYQDIAAEYDVALTPRFLEQVALAGGMMQDDGIHPTADAQPLLLQALLPQLQPLLSAAR